LFGFGEENRLDGFWWFPDTASGTLFEVPVTEKIGTGTDEPIIVEVEKVGNSFETADNQNPWGEFDQVVKMNKIRFFFP
jgi:hypothetical protein